MNILLLVTGVLNRCLLYGKVTSGDFLTEEMSAEDVLKVRNTSKSKNSQYSPWNTFEEEMWRKTVVKRASKYWPKSSTEKGNRLDSAIHVINEHEGLEDPYKEITDKFLSLWEDGATDLVLYGYVSQWPHESEEVQAIYRCFPKGHKGKINEKIKEGKKELFAYIDVFSGDDEHAIEECKAELSEIELKIIDKALKH